MKLQTIYNELSSVYNAMESRNDGIFKLLESIKESIKLETVKESNQKDRYKAANLILKNKASKSRPILQKAYIRDGFQLFTDSFAAFKLLNHIPELDTNEPEASYPNMETLFNIAIQGDETVSLHVETLKRELKVSGSQIAIELSNGIKAFFESKYIKIAIDILELKNDEFLKLRYRPSKNNGFANVSTFYCNHNGDEVLLLPLRKESVDDVL